MPPDYSDEIKACVAACEKLADACFVSAGICRRTGFQREYLKELDACCKVCDSVVLALHKGNTSECMSCAKACYKVAGWMKGVEDSDFIACREAARLCAEACLKLVGIESIPAGWQETAALLG